MNTKRDLKWEVRQLEIQVERSDYKPMFEDSLKNLEWSLAKLTKRVQIAKLEAKMWEASESARYFEHDSEMDFQSASEDYDEARQELELLVPGYENKNRKYWMEKTSFKFNEEI